MDKEQVNSIQKQRSEVFSNEAGVVLHAACRLSDGILGLNQINQILAGKDVLLEASISCFVPASGSGSRMFSFLFEYLINGVENDMVKRFFDELPSFPFYEELSELNYDLTTEIGKKKLINYLLNEEGLSFGSLPKGMIPFHRDDEMTYNPFQDQYRQAIDLLGDKGKIHFTVQEKYLGEIKAALGKIDADINQHVQFSFQDGFTDAYCFDVNGDVVMEGEQFLRRPAGHGALLSNLNDIDADNVLIKNIDNIQPFGAHETTKKYWQYALGLLQSFKEELISLQKNFTSEKLKELNSRFEFLHASELEHYNEGNVHELFDRPTRVCGMVKNTGKPGVGPFWIQENGVCTKQIVEKSQVSELNDQLEIFNTGTHFNPVFIAVSKTDLKGDRLNLSDFVDESKYFTVEKTNEGKQILYRELPGLWNGSMANWNTIFIEVPEDVFTPVKTVLDLLDSAHRS